MQFTTINNIRVWDQGNLRRVNYTGTVHELTYTTNKFISQYIPVPRFRSIAGPERPDPNGTTAVVSNSVFSYPFDRQTIELIGTQLQGNSVRSTSKAGL